MEHICLLLRLDALRHTDHVKAWCQAHYSGHDLAALTLVCHGFDEAAIDLQLAERQCSKMPQARISGAEVVQCKLAAHFSEFDGYLSSALQFIDQGALGNFHCQLLERKPVFPGCISNL